MKSLSIAFFILAVCWTCPPAATATTPAADTAKAEAPASEPFAWGDFTWLNGNDRRHSALLDSKYFTGEFLLDANYTYSNHHPVDNTVVGSTALARNNEVEVSCLAFGGDLHYGHARARLLMQFGTRSTVVPRNDFSVLRGQFDLANVYRYFSEANAGYHFDALHGINVDVGTFMSYVGLFSYYNAENWAYQPSFTSDNTPWFFNGVRIQIFLSDRLKIEPWIVNGWQTYAKFNNGPGLGCQILWRPEEWLSLLSNNYYGTDTQDRPDRVRFHTDNSVEVRYMNRPGAFAHRAAFSITGDVGSESGGGVSGFTGSSEGPAQFFVSGMAYHRMWFSDDHLGWTFGGGFIHNPGRYLVLYPTGHATPGDPSNAFTQNPGDPFVGWDVSTTIDWMPDESQTWRLEFVHREANVPYFAGPGGVTSPDGYITTPIPAGWKPDLTTAESRIILALLFRM